MNIIYPLLLLEWLLTSTVYKPVLINNDTYSLAGNDTPKIIEKVYLHTDRNYYYPGDDIWFKTYLVEASDNHLSDNSNNLHVEFISPANKIIDSRIVRIENGLGKGDFAAPKDLQSGRYRLRAYTNYMRNFGDRAFFNKEISVINPLEADVKTDSSIRYIEDRISISFFPEGGSLVDNIPSKVAFKAVDASGKGCDVSGEVYSSDGKLVTSFRSGRKGMGSFMLRPLPGLSYSAVVKGKPGIAANTKIPGSFSTGVTLAVAGDDSDDLILTVKTNSQTFLQVRDRHLVLDISAHDILLRKVSFRIRSLNNRIKVPVKDLPDGIILLTLSSGTDKTPLCERLVFLQKKSNTVVQIYTGKAVSRQRDSVSVSIALKGDSDIGSAFLSISAAEDIPNSSSQFPSTISSWFLLESDIRGPVEDPSYYFDPSNPGRLKDLDLLLMVQGWRDFEWKYTDMRYLPEQGFTVSGRVRRLYFDRPIAGSKVNVGLLGENNFIMNLTADSLGRFSLPGVDFTGGAMLVANAFNEKNRLNGEIILDSMKYLPAETINESPGYISVIRENEFPILNDTILKSRIRRKFILSDTIQLDEVKVVSARSETTDPQLLKVKSDRLLYGSPDNELIITPLMENYSNALEALRGRIPGVEVFGTGPEMKVVIRGMSSINGESGPLFILDGAATSFENIINLPVSWIDRIDVLKGASAAAYGVTLEGMTSDGVPISASAFYKIE